MFTFYSDIMLDSRTPFSAEFHFIENMSTVIGHVRIL